PVLVTLLRLHPTTTTAVVVNFFVGAARRNTRCRHLVLRRRAMLGMLAVTTLVIVGTRRLVLLDAARLFLLALDGDSRSGSCSGSFLQLAGSRFGLLTGLFLGLQACGFFSGTLLFQLALLLGLDLGRAALDVGLLLAHFHADSLATGHLQGGGGLALQSDLA